MKRDKHQPYFSHTQCTLCEVVYIALWIQACLYVCVWGGLYVARVCVGWLIYFNDISTDTRHQRLTHTHTHTLVLFLCVYLPFTLLSLQTPEEWDEPFDRKKKSSHIRSTSLGNNETLIKKEVSMSSTHTHTHASTVKPTLSDHIQNQIIYTLSKLVN